MKTSIYFSKYQLDLFFTVTKTNSVFTKTAQCSMLFNEYLPDFAAYSTQVAIKYLKQHTF